MPDGLIFRNRVNPRHQKYFALPENKIRPMVCPVPSPQEGRYAIVTSVGRGMRWTLWRARRARSRRMAKACGPDLPMLGSSAARRVAARRWLSKPGHRGERAISRKPLRREGRFAPVTPVVIFCAFPTGATSIRSSLRPLVPRRDKADASLGRKRAAGMRMLVPQAV